MGVIAGELVHNLRATLDNLVWQLVLLHGQQKPWCKNQFPIYSKSLPADDERLQRQRRKRLGEMLRGVKPCHRAFIEEVQPHQRGDPHDEIKRALDWLSWLNNADKHRFLHAVLAIREHGATVYFVTTDPPGIPVEVVTSYGPLYEGAELMRFRTVGNPNAKVEVHGETPMNIAFGDPGITLPRLGYIVDGIVQIVERFKPDFP